MQEQDFPALYRSANDISIKSQKNFFLALKCHLVFLVIAAILSVVSIPHWVVAVLQVISLLGALACSIYLFGKRPDRDWYAGRAVAESIKTITWRYVCCAEPFQDGDAVARSHFQQKLQAIVNQNRELAKTLTKHLDEPQISNRMTALRTKSLEQRKTYYANLRIKDQLTWYAKKSVFNRRCSAGFFWALIIVNTIAVIVAVFRVKFIAVPFWPTDIFVASAACLLSWMQAKRFSELAASYALTAHEIGLIREQSMESTTNEEFSMFVGDSENAFSREHTQWIARRDA